MNQHERLLNAVFRRRRLLLGASVSVLSMPAIAIKTFSHAASLNASVITPMQFGAKGDGVSDDSTAFNAMYAQARATSNRTVFLRGRRYALTRSIYARNVSTVGEGATLIMNLDSAKSGSAFEWGGSDTLITETNFDLSNRGHDAMQGILNTANDASNQRFFHNRVTSRTALQNGRESNIFGLWFLGTGLDGVYVDDNQFEQCSYGVQINNQSGMTGDVRKQPLGRPSRNLHIRGNSCTDATIGVNTPHILCSNVVIEGNTIAPQKMTLDLPLNVAHVTELVVRGNTVTSNAASANGTLHVEDASGAVTITSNVVTVVAANNGIQFGVDPSVSHDARPATRAVISGNHIQGTQQPGIADTNGILLPDPGTTDTVITGNYIAGFAHGITAVAKSSVMSNTILNCTTPLRVSKDSDTAQNTVR